MTGPEATPPDVEAIAEAVAAGMEFTRRKGPVALVQPARRLPGTPAIVDAYAEIDRIDGERRHELAGLEAYQAAAADRVIEAVIRRTARREARVRRFLPYPRFGEPSPRLRIPVRVNACRIDDEGRAAWLAAQDSRLTWWRHHVRLGVGKAGRYRLVLGDHNERADKGTFHSRSVTILRGRREPTRAALSAGICAATAIGAGTAYGASWAIPRALSALSDAISLYAGKALTVGFFVAVAVAFIYAYARR